MSMAARARGLALAALIAVPASLATGCPRQPDAPDPGMGTPCVELADCNPGETCGLLTLCVEGFCEAEPSLVRPCEGVGTPIRPPDP